jgi:hypothetical protein
VAKTARIAMTTKSSMRVKPFFIIFIISYYIYIL